MANEVVYKRGKVITIYVRGDQTAKKVSQLQKEVEPLLRRPMGAKSILVNLKEAGMPDPGAVRQARRFIKTLDYKKLAMFGAHPWLMRLIMERIIRMSGIGNERIKMFREEKPARKWLRQPRVRLPTGPRAKFLRDNSKSKRPNS